MENKPDKLTYDSDEKVFRPWGYFINIARNSNYLAKIIHVNAGGKLSVQSHNHRSEHWFAVKGNAKVLLENNEFILQEGKSIDIPVKAIHSLHNISESDIEIVEIQRGDILSEDDIFRYEDIYGRI